MIKPVVCVASFLVVLHTIPTSLAASSSGGAAAPSENGALTQYRNLPLWDAGKVPLAKGDGPLDAPFLTAFLPPEGKRNGGSVVIAPGGANIMLMYGAEGLEIAERYNDWGVTAFVLTYRLSPRYGDDARTLDGMRAIQVIRGNAAAWKLDPAKIGFIGFSAGSNMGRTVVASARAGDSEAARCTRARELETRLSRARLRRWQSQRRASL